MIECEFRCIKRSGRAANCRIRIKESNQEMDICDLCLEYFKPEEIEILERY